MNRSGFVITPDTPMRDDADTPARRSAQDYRALFEEAMDAIFISHDDGRFLDVNPQACILLGYTREELIGMHGVQLISPESLRRIPSGHAAVQAGATLRRERELRRKDGTVVTVELATRMLDGGHMIGIARDLSARRQVEAVEAARVRQQAAIAAFGQRALAGADLPVLMDEMTRGIAETLGVPFCEILELLSGGHLFAMRAGVGWREGAVESETIPAGYDSQAGWALADDAPIIVEDVRTETRFSGAPLLTSYGIISGMSVVIRGQDAPFGVLGIHTTVQRAFSVDDAHFLQAAANVLASAIERKRMEARLSHHALHDTVTGLPNRALFLDRLGHAIERARRYPDSHFAVLFLDLDRFKNVNDSLGHEHGDALLVETGKRLTRCIRPTDTIARFGGDEFAVLLEGIEGIHDAIHVATRMQEMLATPVSLGEHEVFVTTSIGIALANPSYARPEEMLRDADTAMYRAKILGKARYAVFDEAMHARAVALLAIETDLRHALERDELCIAYQPVVDLRTRAVVGFEALARWRHPTRGLLPPAAFVPLAEETGLIVAIDRWMLDTACRQARQWADTKGDAPPFVSVNLSARNFAQADLPQRVRAILATHDLSPHALRLEITEDTLNEHGENATLALRALHDLGVRVLVDDFGTGHSSLAHLHRFPLAAVKLDRAFLSGADAVSAEIVRAVIALAHSIGLDVVAEGVETAQQGERLAAMGCDYAQGYFFSPALPHDTADALPVTE